MAAGKPLYVNLSDYRVLGEAIRERREDLGLKQKTLALSVGISDDTLSKIERGKCRSELIVVMEIAEVLQRNIYDLMKKRKPIAVCHIA